MAGLPPSFKLRRDKMARQAGFASLRPAEGRDFAAAGRILFIYCCPLLLLSFVSFRLPAIASRHVRHRLRLRQCRAGSGEAGGEENDKTQTPSAKSSNLQKNIVKVWYLGPTAGNTTNCG
jgi:hypothetical protein